MQLHHVLTLDRAQTGIAVLLLPHVKQDREIVTLIPTVLEIWFVATTTARTSIQLPKVPLIAVLILEYYPQQQQYLKVAEIKVNNQI